MLQDSANEEGLFKAMNRVAYNILEVGTQNANKKLAKDQTVTTLSEDKQSMDNATTLHQNHTIDNTLPTEKDSENTSSIEMNLKNATVEISDDTLINSSSINAAVESSEITSITPSQTNAIMESSTDAINDDDDDDSSAITNSLWYISLEDFIASIQREPELCQFFAEQYILDLKGSSVDPVLNSYTRAFLYDKK